MPNACFASTLVLALALTPLGGKLDTHMSRLEAYGFSGSILVAKGGEVVLDQGYGFADAERKVPFTADTAFDIGSITKQFTAAAILKLEMQGRLGVNDPISRWFEGVPEDKKGITLHHLLTHSAGLEDVFGGDYEEMPRDRLVKTALESKLLWAPGTRYRYSNVGYSLLGAIVELASGKPYEEYLRENLWKPAGMTRTGYRLQEKGPLAHGVDGDGEDWGTPVDKAWAPDGPWWNLRANGGVLSTTGDLYKWHRALEGDAILSREAKAKMFTPHVPEDEEGSSHYGYGWAVFETPRKTRLIAHDGGNGIFNADFRRYVDDGVVLIIGSNRQDFRSIPAVGPITRLIFNADYSPPPAVVKVAPAAIGRHAGSYALPSGGKIHVQALESPSGWPGVTLLPEGKDAFHVLAGGAAPDMAEREKRLLDAYVQGRKGDLAPLAEVFGVPLAQLAERNERIWANLEAERGKFQSFELLGSLSRGGRPVTWIEARFERGKALFENTWDGPNVGFIQIRDKPPGAALYLPESETAFASYDPARGESVRIAFEEDGSLVLRTAGGEARAKRSIPSDVPPFLRAEVVAEGASAGSLEVWLRREPPLGEAKEGLGIAFGRLAPGAFAGVVRLASDWTDYKGQKIAAGLYTLRYAVEPVDGNHMGVSAYRDFFLLVPAADDPGPAAVPSPEELYALSTKASRTNHPASLALFPVERVETATLVKNESGQPTLAIPFGEITLGIVVEGTGEI